MDFATVLSRVVTALDAQGVHYALIGGMAMALHGLQRTTLDLDFILLLGDLAAADQILRSHGYHREFHSENVSHYLGDDPTLGRIDLLHAFRDPTLGMLERATRLPWPDGTAVPVVSLEDLIGLKVQALVNDPSRHGRDWADILQMIRHAGDAAIPIDWELVADYLALFDFGDKLPELAHVYGQTL
ncbi:MAG: nucleotidyl transferase AbiEii/AbiGii toxin family protein [Verrucomicrobia bacterium]|nr:nucleotidyl transferase AbiEii/AbiGii toxin family protein [Verrucomicrobiota bacterium]